MKEITRRAFALSSAIACASRASAANYEADVVIYGGSPAGMAAAQAVVRNGGSVVVVEPSTHIGGLITGGIGCTDTGTPHFVGGFSSEFFNAVIAETNRAIPIPKDPVIHFRGEAIPWRKPRQWDLEPRIARMIFETWVTRGAFPLLKNKRVKSVSLKEKRIQAIELTDGTKLSGKVFIDASYEGDLMSRANVPYTWGREAKSEYNESLAGVRAPHFKANYTADYYNEPGLEYTHHGQFGADIPARDPNGKLLWGINGEALAPEGSADKRVQAYCFRLISTQREDLKLPWPKPKTYSPERYELLLKYVLAHPGISFARMVHFAAVPNGKFDLNASGPFSIDYVGGNFDYPDGDYATRDRIYQDHVDYQQGFLWFLAHDTRVPKELRDEVNSWGLARDENADSNHWPVQMYIREARRMKGDYIMTERDVLETNRKDDSVGMGNFVLDSHWVQRIVDPKGNVRIEGHLDESIRLDTKPYDIPYRSLTPKKDDCQNLLVPVCLSATHVAICTIRMEPVYMMMGHAAGLAAATAAKSGAAVQDVNGQAFLTKLRAEGAVLKPEHKREIKG